MLRFRFTVAVQRVVGTRSAFRIAHRRVLEAAKIVVNRSFAYTRSMRGKSAWLITWENFGFMHWGDNEPKVVAVLPARTPVPRVQEIVAAIWTVTEDLTLNERVAYGLSTSRQKRTRWQKKTPLDGGHFYYGLKPKLYVRKVVNLRCRTKDGKEVLSWVETPTWSLDPNTQNTCTSDNDTKEWSQQ